MREEYQKSLEIIKTFVNVLEKQEILVENVPISDLIEMISISLEKSSMCSAWKEALSLFYQNEIEKNSVLSILKISINLISMQGKTEGMEIDSKILNRIKNAQNSYDAYYKEKQRESQIFSGRGVVYTALTGDYDVLNEPEYIMDGMDYICFTDSVNRTSKVWKFVELKNSDLSDFQLSRHPKILPHLYLPQYDYSIYLDAKLMEIGDMRDYIALYEKNSPMLCFPHFVRDCVYEEAKECIRLRNDTQENIERQMNYYREEGFPEHAGLIDAACMVRKHNDPLVRRTMETWWEELIRWNGKRDQLSFNYACWKNGLQYDICNLFIYQNKYLVKKRIGELPV